MLREIPATDLLRFSAMDSNLFVYFKLEKQLAYLMN